jgi:hypothetical protein
MRWGENKNVHPKHGTDIESVVPPNLGFYSLTLFSQLVF